MFDVDGGKTVGWAGQARLCLSDMYESMDESCVVTKIGWRLEGGDIKTADSFSR